MNRKSSVVSPNVTVIYTPNDAAPGELPMDNTNTNSITIQVSNSAPTTPVKSILGTPRHRRSDSNGTTVETNIHFAKLIILMESIEKNTHNCVPKKSSRLTLVYNGMAIVSLCIAMFFTMTMTYILWIGFYPPRQINSPFFIDRLYDFRDFLTAMRDGSILQGLTDMLATSMIESLHKEFEKRDVMNRYNITQDYYERP